MFSPLTTRELTIYGYCMRKLGVFICHCGVILPELWDVKSVAEKVGKIEDVATAPIHLHVFGTGQQIIRRASVKKGLDGIVVACCSPVCMKIPFRKQSV